MFVVSFQDLMSAFKRLHSLQSVSILIGRIEVEGHFHTRFRSQYSLPSVLSG